MLAGQVAARDDVHGDTHAHPISAMIYYYDWFITSTVNTLVHY